MKKTTKKLLGVSGLALVAGMTIVAAQMPSPNAAAVTTSVTDTLSVRVVGDTPDVNFTAPENGLVTNEPIHTLKFNYENASRVEVKMTYTDMTGTETEQIIWSGNPDFYYGEAEKELNLADFGYGEYLFEMTGYDINNAGVAVKTLSLEYVPTTIDNTTTEEDGSLDIDINNNSETKYVKTEVVRNGVVLWENTVDGDATRVKVPGSVFTEVGTYTIKITTYDGNGNILYVYYLTYEVTVVPDTGAPDTGGLFQNLNIAKEDYLITGLIVFFVLAVVAFGIVMRGRQGRSVKRRK